MEIRDYAKRVKDRLLVDAELNKDGPHWRLSNDDSAVLFLAELVLRDDSLPEFLPTPGPDIKHKEGDSNGTITFDTGGSPGTYEPLPGPADSAAGKLGTTSESGILLQSGGRGDNSGKAGKGRRGK